MLVRTVRSFRGIGDGKGLGTGCLCLFVFLAGGMSCRFYLSSSSSFLVNV